MYYDTIIMSCNSPVPAIGSGTLSGKSGDSERSSSTSDGLRRLWTGKRGRPRIDPRQKGLVEVCLGSYCLSHSYIFQFCLTNGQRRRDQVRKAQRAYRSRKEEEAAFRMNYVQGLENRIMHMTQSFSELISLVEKAGIARGQSDLTHKLHNITCDFLSASQDVEPCSEQQLDDKHTYDTHPRGDHISSSLVGLPDTDTSCPTELPVPATVPVETPVFAPLQQISPHLLEAEVQIPNNFAQRLYFTCIKRAYGLLTSPFADGDEVARVFQYSFRYSDANTMISIFNKLLQTNSHYQSAYVYQVGGAGTHYKNRLVDLSIVRSVSLGPETLSNSDYETWFDPRDIEGWLEENGLVIGGEQSFMYLSEFSSVETCRDMALCPEAEHSLSSQRDIRQSAKVLDVDRFLQGLSSSIIICN